MGILVATLSTKTETTIVLSWNSDIFLRQLSYSIDGGLNFITAEGSGNEGWINIYDLSPNTVYTIILKGIEYGGNEVFSDILQIETYDFPHLLEAPNFVLGEKLTLYFYNPLQKYLTINLIANNGIVVSSDIINTNKLEGFNDTVVVDTLYRSIPNEKKARYKVKIETGDGYTKEEYGGYYLANREDCEPFLAGCFYEDRDPFAVTITGNDQIIIQKKSWVYYRVNSIKAQKYATIKKASIFVNGEEILLSLEGESGEGFGGSVDSCTDTEAFFTVEDSRGFVTQESIKIRICPWKSPTAIIVAERTTTPQQVKIKVTADYSPVLGQNTVTIKLYTKKKTESTYNFLLNLNNNEETLITLGQDYDWDLKIEITDRFGGINTYFSSVPRYIPLIFVDSQKYSVGINCYPNANSTLEIKGEDIYSSLFFVSGDSFSFTDKKINCPILYRNLHIYFSFILPKSMKNVTPTLIALKGNILQGVNNYIFTGTYTDGGFNFLSDSRVVSYSCYKETENNLLIELVRGSGSDAVLDDIEVNALTINFA